MASSSRGLLLRENDELGTVSLRKFYMRRSLRIFPACYCYAAVLFGMIFIRHARIVWPTEIQIPDSVIPGRLRIVRLLVRLVTLGAVSGILSTYGRHCD